MTGRIEICFNNQWGTICDNLWSTADANVACRQLGFDGTGEMEGGVEEREVRS
jgi:deleted-in-malignant-brain-tumors protein 1